MANEDVSLLFTLLCQQKLFTQNRRFSSHLHRTPEKTYLWRRFIPLTLHFTCEEIGLRRPWSCRLSAGRCVSFYCASLTRQLCRLEFFFCHAILFSLRRLSLCLKAVESFSGKTDPQKMRGENKKVFFKQKESPPTHYCRDHCSFYCSDSDNCQYPGNLCRRNKSGREI